MVVEVVGAGTLVGAAGDVLIDRLVAGVLGLGADGLVPGGLVAGGLVTGDAEVGGTV